MKLLLPYFIIILLILQLIMKKTTKRDKDQDDAYWQREYRSNSVRRKDISSLNYISIIDLPYIETDNIELINCFDTIKALSDKKILNLTGYSNTDLKLEYGVANLTFLMQCDENYTILVRCLAKCGSILLQIGEDKAAIKFLEFGIAINTDITSNYTLLASYYSKHNKPQEITRLINSANNIKSITKNNIIKKLTAMQMNC